MNRLNRFFASGGAVCLLCAGVAWGAEAAESAHGAGGGENPVTVNLWQAGYSIVVFVCLLLILTRFAFRPILASLKKREDFIRHSLEDARKSREQAEARLREYEARLDQARSEATGIVDEARRDADVVRRRIEEEARRHGAETIERAKREITLAKDAALKTLFDESVELSASLARSTLKRQMSPEEHQRLVLDSLRELQERQRASN
ncbi:MAG TPA: F0F1 ATP synthase subunit B [Phycisphaerae bacterium]|nr:F0F1 ATP synthase subunit B [Phycisphaerae bacterium]